MRNEFFEASTAITVELAARIDHIKENFSEVVDGDVITLSQGLEVLDCCVYCMGKEVLIEADRYAGSGIFNLSSIERIDKVKFVSTHYFFETEKYRAWLLELIAKNAITLQR